MTDIAGDMERVLAALIEAHEELLAVVQRQRQAISRADGAAIEACAGAQHELTRRISSLDQQRRQLLVRLGAAPNATLPAMAQSLPEPVRGRIVKLADRLRDVLNILQEHLRVLQSAAGALVAHMDGLMQQVSLAINIAGTYGREGRVRREATAGALDMRY